MRLKDMTHGQLMVLCRATDCEECSFLLHEAMGELESRTCRIMVPSHWKENDASRSFPISRDGYVPVVIYPNGRASAITNLDIPKAWERLLEAEHQLMLTLLEDPK